jgi:hypothetical protein
MFKLSCFGPVLCFIVESKKLLHDLLLQVFVFLIGLFNLCAFMLAEQKRMIVSYHPLLCFKVVIHMLLVV